MIPSHSAFLEARRFPALDGLRAVSILLVLTLHTSPRFLPAANGGLGVFIFFVISGFLITTLALREEHAYGALSLRAFYVRRAFRILPLYYLVLLAYVLTVMGSNYRGHGQLLRAAMPYYLTYTNDFTPEWHNLPFQHSWSLGVEEKFYLLWPPIAFLLWRARGRVRMIGTAVLIFLPLVLDGLHLLPFHIERYGMPLYFAYCAILVGCLLACALDDPATYARLARLASGAPALGVLLLFLVAHFVGGLNRWTLFAYPFAVALVLVPILLARPAWGGWLASRPMRFIGERSYAIYLVHLICFSGVRSFVGRLPHVVLDADRMPVGPYQWWVCLLAFLLATAASLVVASVLSVAIEQPCIALGRRWSGAIRARASLPLESAQTSSSA